MATTDLIRIGPPRRAQARCGEQIYPHGSEQHAVTSQFALVWLQAGAAEHVDGHGRRHRLAAGDALHRYPEVIHRVRFAEGARCLSVGIPAEGLAMLRALGAPALDEPVIRPGMQPDLARRWRLLADEVTRARPSSLASLAGRLVELVADLHQRAASGADARLAALMERAARLLADLDAPPLKQPALARSLGLSYRTFRRAFAAHAGLPPEAYRIRCRVAQAQELLRASALPIAAIAERLGYRDGADFSRQFARVAGRSPREYRRDPLLG